MTKIDCENVDMVNSKEVCVHDAVFNGFMFDYENKVVTFEADENFNGNKIRLSFYNVLELKMGNYESWGESPYIFDLCVEKYYNEMLLNNDEDSNRCVKKHYSEEFLFNRYIKSTLTLVSGDTLNIICEYIIYDEL